MPLPATVPQEPKRPPASQPVTGPDGNMTTPWLNYFDALDRFNRALRAHLDTL